MHDTPDHDLLRRYALEGSEDAFTELVMRHCDLVWAAARRVTGDPHAARDVAQSVFADLARKAGRLPPGTVLTGWLYQAAYRAATKQVRGDWRRVRREQHAMREDALQPTPDADAQVAEELQPVLDAVLAELTETDRQAVVLRYLAGKSLAEVGAALGANQDAAQKRVSRALVKLREGFRQRGLTVGGGTLVAALGVAGTQTAPSGMAATLAAGALANTSVTLGAASWLFLMKSKFVYGLLIGAMMVSIALQQWQIQRLTRANDALQRQRVGLAEAPNPTGPANPDPEVTRRVQEGRNLQNRALAAEARAAVAAAEIDARKAGAAFSERRLELVQVAQWLRMAAATFAGDHQQRYPTNFDELREAMTKLTGGALPGNDFEELFEFFPQPIPVSETQSHLFLFREKVARLIPEHAPFYLREGDLNPGEWERVYVSVGGSLHVMSSPTGDFSEFELAGTARPESPTSNP